MDTAISLELRVAKESQVQYLLYEETRSGEILVQLSVNYEGGLKRTDLCSSFGACSVRVSFRFKAIISRAVSLV